jgi:uncharacterized protein YifE (UPF0438 family)
MTKYPNDHSEHLRHRPFVFNCATEVFPPEELDALAEYGNWLDALATGAIKPLTPEQGHFLLTVRGEAEPITLLERAWARLQGRREYEREEQIAPPAPPPEDYGMVEFDADRCWW